MRPHPVPSPADGESDLFRNRLDSLIDMRHEFVRLSGLIDWKRFDEAFGELYAEKGRPGLPTRLMVGLHLIKHARGLSDEQVCAQWLENAYFQYFSGESLDPFANARRPAPSRGGLGWPTLVGRRRRGSTECVRTVVCRKPSNDALGAG